MDMPTSTDMVISEEKAVVSTIRIEAIADLAVAPEF
jgi:hypothetical protein